MASTVGHGLCGVALALTLAVANKQYRAALPLRELAFVAVLANLPDIDFLLGMIFFADPQHLHGGFTHTFAFALAVGAVIGLWLKRWWALERPWWFYSLVVASHPVVDSLAGPNVGLNATKGYALLWPLSEQRLPMPVTLFPGPRHDTVARLFSAHNIWVVVYEIAVFGAVLLMLLALVIYLSRRSVRVVREQSMRTDRT